MVSITHRMWMHHAQDPSWGTRASKQNIGFVSSAGRCGDGSCANSLFAIVHP